MQAVPASTGKVGKVSLPRVAYLGPTGTYTEEAAKQYFKTPFKAVIVNVVDQVFDAVETGQANYGVIAIENTTEGAVAGNLDLLASRDVQICGELSLPIKHHFLVHHHEKVEWVRVRAHAQALAQCHHWLTAHMPHLVREAVVSNAEAARLASLDPSSAAIASHACAESYGLRVAHSSVQDDPGNKTRFLILHQRDDEQVVEAKTSLILSIRDQVGALLRVVEPFARQKVSMSRFESRPTKTGNWEYRFYIDLIGHRKDENVAAALEEIEQHAEIRMLGSYRKERES